MGYWKPFPDTKEAIIELQKIVKVLLITNTDDTIIAQTERTIGVKFDDIITAQQAKSYKPSFNNFNLALKKIGLPKENILHAAESLYHDVAPANELGIANVWVNRRGGKPGATKDIAATPGMEVPDIKTLAEVAVR